MFVDFVQIVGLFGMKLVGPFKEKPLPVDLLYSIFFFS